MNTNIFIPKRINVGFRNRTDTYTGKLAYIIYFDEFNKLRKETSWNNWRDHNIDPQQFDNEPTSGFVMNKKVGDYDSGWNHRRGYCRIYDPRGFEFEITFENLLYILENADSVRGKGLVGDFVYGWDGKDLVLIPTEAPDYKQLVEYNTTLHDKQNVKAKDLIIGATYINKKNERRVYLGKFDYYEECYMYTDTITGTRDYSKGYRRRTLVDIANTGNHRLKCKLISQNKGKKFYFAIISNTNELLDFESFSSITNRLIKCENDTCIDNYADLLERLKAEDYFSPIGEVKIIPYTKEQFNDIINATGYCIDIYCEKGYPYRITRDYESTTYTVNVDIPDYVEHMDDYSDILDDLRERFGTKVEKDGGFYYSDYAYRSFKAYNVGKDELFDAIHPCYIEIYSENKKLRVCRGKYLKEL